jgi:glycosyltransferase involved in cell wall biosynthesis
MEYPKVSVIISTYNRVDLLKKAIMSAKRQLINNIEIIVVDDCSTDGTEAMVAKIMKKDKRVSYYRNDKNFGSDTQPKNLGVSKAKCKYIAFLDDDVTWRKNHLKVLLKQLEADKKLDGAYGDMWIMPNDEAGIAHDFDRQFLMFRNYIDMSAIVFKKDAFYDVGGLDETLNKFVDWNLWVRMIKAGKIFKRVPKVTFDYLIHKDTKSQRVKTETYMHPQLGQLWVPTFDPTGCDIQLPYMGEIKEPRVAIFTIHYDRLDYSKETYKQMKNTAGYDFDWFCVDNGSKDGTKEWLKEISGEIQHLISFKENMGITEASNRMIDIIKGTSNYDIIIKIDNDVEFQTSNWLTDMIGMWKKNRKMYLSPYVEGLYHNPGGAPRRGYGFIGDEYIEVTNHVGGIFAFIDASAYDEFRWKDKMLHGNQDTEASHAFRDMGFMPCYYPKHRICHMDGTQGQADKYIEYFDRRKSEKTTKA